MPKSQLPNVESAANRLGMLGVDDGFFSTPHRCYTQASPPGHRGGQSSGGRATIDAIHVTTQEQGGRRATCGRAPAGPGGRSVSCPDRAGPDRTQSRRLSPGADVWLRQLGRSVLHHREPQRRGGSELAQCVVGADDRVFAVLASADVALPSARHRAVRDGRRLASRDQCRDPRDHHRPALPAVPADDARHLAERAPRGPLRGPSAACRIGRVGGRAQGRAEHAVLGARGVGLRELHARSGLAARTSPSRCCSGSRSWPSRWW